MTDDARLKEFFSLEAVTMDMILTPSHQIDDREQLATAVRVALGTDALAGPNDVLPDPDSTDRRGWWGDMDAEKIWGGWPIGCKNWLLTRAKISDEFSVEGSTVARAQAYTEDALQPFIDQKIASEIQAVATRTADDRIEVRAKIFRGPIEEIALRYQQVWQEPDIYDLEHIELVIVPNRLENIPPFIGSPLMGLIVQIMHFHPSALLNSGPSLGRPLFAPLGPFFFNNVASLSNSSPVVNSPAFVNKGVNRLGSIAALINTAPLLGPLNFIKGGPMRPVNLVNTVPQIQNPNMLAINDLGVSTRIDGDFDTYNFSSVPSGIGTSPWWALNSTWNKGALVNGVDFGETIFFRENAYPDATVFQWAWPGSPPASGDTYAYPCLILGTYADQVPLTNIPALSINNINSLNMIHDIVIGGGQEDNFSVKYSSLLSPVAGPSSTPVAEIDIYLHVPSYRQAEFDAFPSNQKYAFTDSQGTAWTIIDNPGGNPHQFVMFKTGYADILTYSVDLKSLLVQVKANGLLTGNEFFTGITLGVEPKQGSGITTINSVDYVYQSASISVPTVTSVSPASGPPAGGTSVVIVGTNFTGATAVKFGAIDANSFVVNSPTQITAVSPAEAVGAVDITVTTPQGTSSVVNIDKFTFAAATAPTITSINPASGSQNGGTSVVIVGTNFTNVTAVRFGGVNATSFTVNSATQITAVSPAGNGTQDITVTTTVGVSPITTADAFNYTSGTDTIINLPMDRTFPNTGVYKQPGTPWMADNSPWGSGGAGSYNWTENIQLHTSTFPNNTVMTWDWGPTFGGVMGYPFVGYGRYAANWDPPNVLLTPKQIKNLSTLKSTHNCTLAAPSGSSTGDFDVIYDYYLTTNPNGQGGEPAGGGQGIFEITIFVHNLTGNNPDEVWQTAAKKGTLTDADGIVWRFFHAPQSGIPDRIIYYPTTPTMYADCLVNKTIDHAQFLKAAVTAGIATGNEYFNGLAIGAEPGWHMGTFTLVSFSVNYV